MQVQGWKEVWQAPVIPKVKHFLWRIFKGSLPTRVELRRRHMSESGLCAMCGIEEETVLHASVQCRCVDGIWEAVDELASVQRRQLMSWGEFMHILARGGDQRRAAGLTMAWFVSNRRNRRVFENFHRPDTFWVDKMRAVVSVERGAAMNSVSGLRATPDGSFPHRGS